MLEDAIGSGAVALVVQVVAEWEEIGTSFVLELEDVQMGTPFYVRCSNCCDQCSQSM